VSMPSYSSVFVSLLQTTTAQHYHHGAADLGPHAELFHVDSPGGNTKQQFHDAFVSR